MVDSAFIYQGFHWNEIGSEPNLDCRAGDPARPARSDPSASVPRQPGSIRMCRARLTVARTYAEVLYPFVRVTLTMCAAAFRFLVQQPRPESSPIQVPFIRFICLTAMTKYCPKATKLSKRGITKDDPYLPAGNSTPNLCTLLRLGLRRRCRAPGEARATRAPRHFDSRPLRQG